MLGRSRIARHAGSAVMTLAVLASQAPPARAQWGQLSEHQVKAAFLYNIMKFVEWPPESNGPQPLVICVVGRGPFSDALETIVKGKQLNGREVVTRRLQSEDDPQSCHSIFIVASEARQAATILERVRSAPVLTVGETPHFLSEGGHVRFYVEANRVRFQIDPVGTQLSGLRISSQLLSLAAR